MHTTSWLAVRSHLTWSDRFIEGTETHGELQNKNKYETRDQKVRRLGAVPGRVRRPHRGRRPERSNRQNTRRTEATVLYLPVASSRARRQRELDPLLPSPLRTGTRTDIGLYFIVPSSSSCLRVEYVRICFFVATTSARRISPRSHSRCARPSRQSSPRRRAADQPPFRGRADCIEPVENIRAAGRT